MAASAQPTSASSTRPGGRLDSALVKLALVLLIGSLASGLGTSIANVTIDSLGATFDASVATMQWVSTGYLLALSMVVPLTGWIVERLGARRVWLACLALVVGASVLCAAAWSIEALVAFRILQGAGGGMLLPLIRLILARAAGRNNMGRAMVFVAVPAALTPALGPVIGGLLVTSLSWRWAFLLTAPLCLLGLILAWRALPLDRPEASSARLDLTGLILLSLGFGAAIYGLAEAGAIGGFGHVAPAAGIGLGAALLGGYCWHALRNTRTPVVDLRLFRVRSFAASASLLFLLGASLFGALFIMPLYYQQSDGASALRAGLLLAPLGLGMAISMTSAGKIIDRTGAERTIILFGMSLAAIGLVPFTLIDTDTSQTLLSGASFSTGLGLGAVVLAALTATYRGLTAHQMAPATVAARIAQQIGGVLGTAVLAVVLQHATTTGLDAPSAFARTFTWSLAFTALAFIPALLLPRREKSIA